MSIVDGIIVNNVGWGDISAALDVAGPPYDIGYMIENSTTLNKWAKYKPLASSKIGYLTEAERKTLKQGMTVTMYTSPADLRNNFSSQWDYTRPSEAQGHKFRSHDFVQVTDAGAIVSGHGYNKNAAVPISGWVNKPQGEHTLSTVDLLASIGLRPSGQTPADSVKLSDVSEDVTGFGNMYLGIMLFYGTSLANSTYAGLKTYTDSGGTVRNISWLESNNIQMVDVTFTDADLPVPSGASSRTYYFMPVISRASAATLDTDTSKYTGGIYACPNADIATLVVKPASTANLLILYPTSHDFSFSAGRLMVSVPVQMWGTRSSYYANVYYELYASDTASGTLLASGTFYSDTVPQTPSYATATFTYNSRMEMPEYLTLVFKDANTQAVLATVTDIVTNDDLL